MRLALNPARTTPLCKIKRVDPAFRSVSTPRSAKDLPVVGPVYPEAAAGVADGLESAAENTAKRLSAAIRSELVPAPCAPSFASIDAAKSIKSSSLKSGLSEIE